MDYNLIVISFDIGTNSTFPHLVYNFAKPATATGATCRAQCPALPFPPHRSAA